MKDLYNGDWPNPKKVKNMGVFAEIKDIQSFNKIIGNPDNWEVILKRKDLFNDWILPCATIYVGKTWFNKVKNLNQISNGVPFPLIYENQEKATIIKIIQKTYSVLIKYLEGDWYEDSIKNPSGYIMESLKNKFAVEIGKELGYKQKSSLICPYCFCSRLPSKILLDEYPNMEYSCPQCSSIIQNSSSDDPRIIKEYENRKIFKKFIGITCICPSSNCPGKFIPISCFKDLKPFKISIKKNIKSFQRPPKFMLDFSLTCPYCETIFTPRNALKQKSGFKNKSGYLTGLPYTRIWKREEFKFDVPTIVNECFDDYITIKQHLNILIDELIIQISKTNNLLNKYFMLGVINWIIKYGGDANLYFFNKELKGRESIHRKIFDECILLLEQNIKQFKYKSIEDFRWLARPPKFSGGPRTTFYSVVNNQWKIPNKTDIRPLSSNKMPRLAKIYSITKNGKDFTDKIEDVGWNSIKLIREELNPGDKVLVDALIMPGHSTNIITQKIIRLKHFTKTLVEKVLEEEETGERDIRFWNNWEKNVKTARDKTGISVKI